MTLRALVLSASCLAAALVAWRSPADATTPPTLPRDIIYPRASVTIRFDHKVHADKGAGCLVCHEAAKTSTTVQDSLLPNGSACDVCHGSDHADPSDVTPGTGKLGECVLCHVGPARRMVVPRANLRFSHKAHMDRTVACAQCHDDAARYPDMRACLKCHGMQNAARGDAKSGCPVCHLTEKDGRLRVRFDVRTPQGTYELPPLMPPRWLHDAGHTPDFVVRHKRVAGDDSRFCGSCHAERFCTDCHDGRVRPRTIHPNDWLSMHPVAARKNAPTCSSCHNDQSFCLECHSWAGVSEVGASAQGRRLHPDGWSGLGASRGPGHHAWEAQRNLGACVGCHTERDCAVCHASPGRRGLGIDPHPPGFASGCRTQLARNRRPCLVCHDPTSAELGRCN